MKTEIIAVGTELLLGQIANTNAQWISEQMAGIGLPVFHHSVVGDNLDRVTAEFKNAGKRSDLIVVTGGLGPTEDDLTREAGAKVLQVNLMEDKAVMDKISRYYERNNRKMSPNNRKQALVFEGADILDNSEGMAPGQWVEADGTIWIFLPGVPVEMKELMNTYILPRLQRKYQIQSQIVSEMLRFIGIGESDLETRIGSLITKQTNPTIAPLAGEGEVGLRLTATGTTTDDAFRKIACLKEKILDHVGSYYYGSDAVTIEEKVKDLLHANRWTIGAAESFTGGMFQERFISLPGASSVCKGGYIVYTANMKEKVLHIPEFLIKEYGTVSSECAEMMALQTQSLLGTDVAVSFTGVAGPDSSEGHEAGTVYIGIQAGEQKPVVHKYHLPGGRQQVRLRAVKKAYELLYHLLKSE